MVYIYIFNDWCNAIDVITKKINTTSILKFLTEYNITSVTTPKCLVVCMLT